jgi:hypothetical protein
MRRLLFLLAVAVCLYSQPARTLLLRQAGEALQAGPFSVMHKKRTPPSGDKHDYMSVGPYWWPDPSKPDGLPYIRKDGVTNPDRLASDTDGGTMKRMHEAVGSLALAWRETRSERYATKAAALLRTWYLDPATRMKPNLDFGQSIPGRVDGRGTGIIDTVALIYLCEHLRWLETSQSWKAGDGAGMKRWMTDYLTWLQTSKNGREEAAARNNHGTWYDAQVAALAIFTGQIELGRRTVEAAKAKRIAVQIAPDGSQPLELERTKALSYSTMNLRAFFELATLGDSLGVDLWRFETPDGRGIRKAMNYLSPYVDPERAWPGQQITGGGLEARMDIAALLRRAAIAYKDQEFEKRLSVLPQVQLASQRWQLLYPPR